MKETIKTRVWISGHYANAEISKEQFRKEAQKELLMELYEKGSYTTEEYINIINQKLKELEK